MSSGSMTLGQTNLIKVEEGRSVGAASYAGLLFFRIVAVAHRDWNLAGDAGVIPPGRCKINSDESKCCFPPLSSTQQVLSLIATSGDLKEVNC